MPDLFVLWRTVKSLRLAYFTRYFIIATFLLQTERVFCILQKDTLFHVSEISITGNKVSREEVILKELTFKTGDSLSLTRITIEAERSRENLLNTSLFNFVEITFVETTDKDVRFNISLIERWYIWPSPIFEHAERNLGTFIHDPDWNRINYGGQIYWDNFRGRRETLKLKLRFGYKEQKELSYEKPNFGKKQQHGLNFTLNHTRQHEINLYNENNKPVYLRNENSYLAEVFNPYVIYSLRTTLYTRHSLFLAWYSLKLRDSLSHEIYTGLPAGKDPGFFSFDYSYEYDFRDSKSYPLKGNYFRVNLRRRQSPFPDEIDYSKSSALINIIHHGFIANRLYYNDALRLYISKDKYEPKVYRTGLGYGPFLRGYELYVMDGNSYGLMINNLKYCIMKERSYNLILIPWSQFNPAHFSMYGNLFFDMAYVHGNHYDSDGNNYVNRLLFSGGLGLDLVSYYDQVLRLEVSLNREGQAGFFIHVEVPFNRW